MTSEQVTKIEEMVYEILVREVMTKNVITVTPSTPMRDLREILRVNRISGTPVVEEKVLVGIISIEDFVRWLADGSPDCPIAAKMTRTAGRIAARSIDLYLGGKGNIEEVLAPVSEPCVPPEEQGERPRVKVPQRLVSERLADSAEVELGYSEDLAVLEAIRCLRCDLEKIED